MVSLARGEKHTREGNRRPICALLAAVALLAGVAAGRGQTPPNSDVTYTRQTFFRIPYQIDANAGQIKQVTLYVSSDEGRTWHWQASAAPEQRYFDFSTPRDGLFWFAVRTVDVNGLAYPADPNALRPSLKVCVDTQPPAITLQAMEPRDGMVGVRWDVHDSNLDANSVRLDYHLPQTSDWLPLAVQPAAKGEYFWKPAAGGAFEVRLQARDRAGNSAEQRLNLVAGQAGPAAAAAVPRAPDVRMVNSKRISLNYELKDVGKSGISVVELWYTTDGRNWQKYGENPSNSSPYVFEVLEEGLYGFSLVARSGVGLGEKPPQVGDPPQIWVEVDLTRPIVRLLGVEVGRGAEAGNLTITWSATDKNLARTPITLSYAEKPEGPWTQLGPNIENTGRYVWHMPENVPYQFLVRVEAQDRAGNKGSAETSQPVKVDLSLPKPHILDVSPAK